VSDFDFFPEASYNPTSGEYSGNFDFEPTFTARIYLNFDKTLWVDVTSISDYEPINIRVIDELNKLSNSGIFEPSFDPDNPNGYPEIPPDFDYGDPNVRGPFQSDEEVDNFLDKSGLRGIAIVYYDSTQGEFWIDVNTT
jgi:hypothetical protein